LTLIAYLQDDDNHKSEVVPAIRPPVTVEKSRVSSILAAFKTERSTPYDDSGSDSGDQFRPPEHPESEEEDDLEADVEVESEGEGGIKARSEPTKVKYKKGKSKPGRKDIIATRKTHATTGTPSAITAKSGTHEKERNTT